MAIDVFKKKKGDKNFARSHLTFLKSKAEVLTVIFPLWKRETIDCILLLNSLHHSILMIS